MLGLLGRAGLFLGAACCVLPGTVAAQVNRFALRTEPSLPVAGEPFAVVAFSTECERLFVGNPYNEPEAYDNVSVVENTISIRVGYFPPVVCNNEPVLLRFEVPGLPAGSYRLDLVGRFLFTTDDNLLDSIGLVVAMAPRGVPAMGAMEALLLILGVGAYGLRPIRHHTIKHG